MLKSETFVVSVQLPILFAVRTICKLQFRQLQLMEALYQKLRGLFSDQQLKNIEIHWSKTAETVSTASCFLTFVNPGRKFWGVNFRHLQVN